jgi:tetratricopeptide (TPR) repeat protein
MRRGAIVIGVDLVLITLSVVGCGQGPDLKEVASLSQKVIQFYMEGHYEEAIPLAERALKICEKRLGPEHPKTAMSFNNLALLYSHMGFYDKALPWYERALEIDEKALGVW